jgi:hypothetical protein
MCPGVQNLTRVAPRHGGLQDDLVPMDIVDLDTSLQYLSFQADYCNKLLNRLEVNVEALNRTRSHHQITFLHCVEGVWVDKWEIAT